MVPIPLNFGERNGPIPSVSSLSHVLLAGQLHGMHQTRPPWTGQSGLDQANQAYGIDSTLPAEERAVRVHMLRAAVINTIPEASRRPFAQVSQPAVLRALRISVENFYGCLTATLPPSSTEATLAYRITTVHHAALSWYIDQVAQPSEPTSSIQALSPYLLHEYVVKIHRMVFPDLQDSSRWETGEWMWGFVHDDQQFRLFFTTANYCIYLARFKCYTQALERSAAIQELTRFIFEQLLDSTSWLREDVVTDYVADLWDNPTMEADMVHLLKAALDHDQTDMLVNAWAEQYMQHGRVEYNDND
ncbi:hypothetical protein H4R34_004365 [Dimargaris verticillata]|uniref:Uncharacterized protein n=1 Tax=Dimargaris verticillata TaxID=2761393 RepID=A0A9W8B525_9FUNG|nr:hypothetical protein H4R34_004365 [Dimargaris verticillata]